MMTGCAKNGFKATFRTLAYATGATVLGWIPCVGTIAAIYEYGLVVFGLSKLQDSTVGRALAAVLLPIGVACCCAGCGALFVGFAAAKGAG
jgi:hypothetical protein